MQWFLEVPNVIVNVYTIHLRAPSSFYFTSRKKKKAKSLAKSPSDSPTRLSYTQCCLWPFSPCFLCVWNLRRATLAGSEWSPTGGWLRHEAMRCAADRRPAIQLQSCSVFTSWKATSHWLPCQGALLSPSANEAVGFLSGLLRKTWVMTD